MNKSSEILCAHGGLVFAGLMGVGLFGVAGWLPPVLPSADAATIATMLQQHTFRIRLGVDILALASAFFWPFAVAITNQMRRIEGQSHPFASVQLASATGTVIAILLASYLWLGMAFRPDIDPPGVLQYGNDIAWMTFVGMYPPAFIQCLSIGLGILSDKAQTIYPRWVAFANFWAAILFVPGAAVPFFQHGPFAWNGLIAFWMVAAVFFGWIVMMWWMTIRAVRQAP